MHCCRVIALSAGILVFCGMVATASADGYDRPGSCCALSWNGYYVGVNGGYGWESSQTVHVNETFAGAPFSSFNYGSLSPDGAFGGFQVGANRQSGSLVFGVEMDAQGSDIVGNSAFTQTGNSATVTTSNKVEAFGTIRARAGFLAGYQTLLYGTGGIAFGDIVHRMTWADIHSAGGGRGGQFFTGEDRENRGEVGYVLGAGIEHIFSPHMSVKLEYQYIDFGTQHYSSPEMHRAVASEFVFETSTRTDLQTVRLGLNYQFYEDRSVPLK